MLHMRGRAIASPSIFYFSEGYRISTMIFIAGIIVGFILLKLHSNGSVVGAIKPEILDATLPNTKIWGPWNN